MIKAFCMCKELLNIKASISEANTLLNELGHAWSN